MREDVQPTASNMHLISYSVELEQLAEEWLAHCDHRKPDSKMFPQYKGVGQILTIQHTENLTFEDTYYYLRAQKDYYDFENNECEDYCGDYEQVSNTL
uniref:SCP domain-containing protein n=1 Tax=Mesocestoides corti TaxID=53468 RepID=A0A5K3FT17_MESCO